MSFLCSRTNIWQKWSTLEWCGGNSCPALLRLPCIHFFYFNIQAITVYISFISTNLPSRLILFLMTWWLLGIIFESLWWSLLRVNWFIIIILIVIYLIILFINIFFIIKIIILILFFLIFIFFFIFLIAIFIKLVIVDRHMRIAFHVRVINFLLIWFFLGIWTAWWLTLFKTLFAFIFNYIERLLFWLITSSCVNFTYFVFNFNCTLIIIDNSRRLITAKCYLILSNLRTHNTIWEYLAKIRMRWVLLYLNRWIWRILICLFKLKHQVVYKVRACRWIGNSWVVVIFKVNWRELIVILHMHFWSIIILIMKRHWIVLFIWI